jgi:hypothetical protein
MLVGGERTANFPGELRRKGNHELAVLPPPLHDSIYLDTAETTVDLLNHSMVQGMAGIDDIWWNSGELLQVIASNRDNQRGIGVV